MKFEFDHRTGTMLPKKDKQIYFAKSQGGGLLIDDKKNNVRYVIEKDESITNIIGIRGDKVNLYDMKDARIIAERVMRMFGREHKYTDFHYFLRGYRMSENVILNFDEFIEESRFVDLIDKKFSGKLRREDGQVIGQTEDGDKLIIPNDYVDNGSLVDLGSGKDFSYIESADTYIACVSDGSSDVFYKYDNDNSIDTVGANMIEWFTIESKYRKYVCGSLEAMGNHIDLDNLDDIDIEDSNHFDYKLFDSKEYFVFWSKKSADNYAIDREKELFEQDGVGGKEDIDRYNNLFGDKVFDVDAMQKELEESYRSYYRYLKESDAIEELLNHNVIKDDEEYFYLDEDDNPDHDRPKFNYRDYTEEYVEKVIDNINDIVDEFITNYGIEGIEEYMDLEKLAEVIVDEDGRGEVISPYNGKEIHESVDDEDYYIYRMN